MFEEIFAHKKIDFGKLAAFGFKAEKDGVYVHVINFTLLPLFFCFRRLYNKEWYENVDMAKYLALIIDSLNHDYSISSLLNPVTRINRRLKAYKERREALKQ